jgi:hypothetical protein
MFPELGLADLDHGVCWIRDDLPPWVKVGVLAHELGHLRLRTPSELLAIAYGFLTAPIASATTVFFLLTNRRQRAGALALYKARWRAALGWRA